MTNKNTEKDWDKLKPYIKNISIGQYDDNGVNIGSVKADEMIWNFIQQKIKEAEEGVRERISKQIEKTVMNPMSTVFSGDRWLKIAWKETLLLAIKPKKK